MHLQVYRLLFILITFLGVWNASPALAADPVTTHLTIRHEDVIVFDADVSTTTEGATTVLAMLQAADEASDDFAITDLAYYASFNDYLLNCITFGNPETNACYSWKYVVNGEYPFLGIGSYTISGGESIYLYFGDRYRLETEATEVTPDDPLIARFSEYDFEANAWLPKGQSELLATEPILPDYSNWPPATVLTTTTDNAGAASFLFSTTGTYYITIPNDYWPGVTVGVIDPPEEPAPSVRLVVRYGETFLFDEEVVLPTSTVISYTDSATGAPGTTTTLQTSVLSLLLATDAATSSLSVTPPVYYEQFGSFLVNCINDACYSWNYVVDEQYPQIGLDQYRLLGGETIYVYFSSPWQITTPSTTVEVGEEVSFATWRYEYDNIEGSWTPDPNTSVQISVPNPAPTGWWDATIPVATITSNESGIATTTFSATGTFSASITSADFSKWSSPVTVEVVEPAVPLPPANNTQNSNGGGTSAPPAFDVPRALIFITTQQNSDGSFGTPLYTDWAGIALGAVPGTSAAEDRLRAYLLTNPDPGSLLTDIERRAMALMALGINPYTGTQTNYIERIVDNFSNGQFGDVGLFNDDVFAFFPLIRAGVSPSDPRIASSTAFILSFQEPNGSWGSVDMTGATIQALALVPDIPGVSAATVRGVAYLEQTATDNVFSAAWSNQGLAAAGRAVNDAQLLSFQEADGGVTTTPLTPNNRVWGTSTVIPAALHLPWGQILAAFTPPMPAETNQQAGGNNSQASGGFVIPPQPEEVATTTTTGLEEPQTETPLAPTDIQEGSNDSTNGETDQTPVASQPSADPTASANSYTPPPTSEETPATTADEITATLPASEKTVLSQNPIQEAARDVFAGSASMTAGLGLYLAWRFLKFIV